MYTKSIFDEKEVVLNDFLETEWLVKIQNQLI